MKWVSDVIMWSLQTRIENCCSRTRILSPLMKVRQCKCKFVGLKFKVLFFGRLWHYCNMHCMFRCATKFNSTRQNEAKLTARLKYFFKKRNSSLNRWKLGTTSTHEYKCLSSVASKMVPSNVSSSRSRVNHSSSDTKIIFTSFFQFLPHVITMRCRLCGANSNLQVKTKHFHVKSNKVSQTWTVIEVLTFRQLCYLSTFV